MRNLIFKILKENEFDWIESPFGIDDTLMEYLIQNYPVGNYREKVVEFLGNKYVMVDDKPYPLEGHKKQLTNKIYWEVVDEFSNINEPVLRRTIKTFLNNIASN